MNTFQLHEAAQQLAESETAYNIARMYLTLKHDIKFPEHEHNIVDAVKHLGPYAASELVKFINFDCEFGFSFSYIKTIQTVFTIDGYNECIKELAEAAWLNDGEPQYYHIYKRVELEHAYDEAWQENAGRMAYNKYLELQNKNVMFISLAWDRLTLHSQQVWIDMVNLGYLSTGI